MFNKSHAWGSKCGRVRVRVSPLRLRFWKEFSFAVPSDPGSLYRESLTPLARSHFAQLGLAQWPEPQARTALPCGLSATQAQGPHLPIFQCPVRRCNCQRNEWISLTHSLNHSIKIDLLLRRPSLVLLYHRPKPSAVPRIFHVLTSCWLVKLLRFGSRLHAEPSSFSLWCISQVTLD